MRSIVSTVVILFSVCALVGGYLSGTAAVPQIVLHARVPDPGDASVPQTDEVALDEFASDPVTSADVADGSIEEDSQLAVVVVGCGRSTVLEAPFLELGIPVTLVIDPQAPQAARIAELARAAGQTAYVQADASIDAVGVAQLQAAFASVSGIAMRSSSPPAPGVQHELRLRHLRFFDEYADDDAAARQLPRDGVSYAGRSITVDDYLESGYVRYMLAQAVRFGRARLTVVLARPYPTTLDALRRVIETSSARDVRFVALP